MWDGDTIQNIMPSHIGWSMSTVDRWMDAACSRLFWRLDGLMSSWEAWAGMPDFFSFGSSVFNFFRNDLEEWWWRRFVFSGCKWGGKAASYVCLFFAFFVPWVACSLEEEIKGRWKWSFIVIIFRWKEPPSFFSPHITGRDSRQRLQRVDGILIAQCDSKVFHQDKAIFAICCDPITSLQEGFQQ